MISVLMSRWLDSFATKMTLPYGISIGQGQTSAWGLLKPMLTLIASSSHPIPSGNFGNTQLVSNASMAIVGKWIASIGLLPVVLTLPHVLHV